MRRNALAGLALGVALALPGQVVAEATDGFVLNPTGRDLTREREPRGMSWIRDSRRRTPTGFLYPYPLEPLTLNDLGGGWQGGGSLSIGGVTTAGDDSETRFHDYADWGSTLLVDSFRATFLQPERGLFLEARGGAVGRDDQFYAGEFSWLGRFRLRTHYSGVPRSYARDAKTLYQGLGNENLRLRAGLTPGANDDPTLVMALSDPALRRSRLEVQRNDGSVQADAWLRPDTRLFARYEVREREGERPFGGSWLYATGFAQARAAETIEPIDDLTHDFSVGAQYAKPNVQANLTYTGSLYRNHHEKLVWDNPFALSGDPTGIIERGRFALAPDNDWHNVKADVALSIPLDGRATATASWSRMEQDGDLLPPTVNSGILNGLDLDQWNTEAALNRSGANARTETLLLRGDVRIRPWKPLRLRAQVRYFDRKNDTTYTAFNPQTGDFGYVTEDGALAAFPIPLRHQFPSNPAAEDFRYRSTPYGYDKLEVEGRADARLHRKTNLGLRYAWERRHYDHRERDETIEHRVRAELSSRNLERATVRVSYEYADRSGDDYEPFPYSRYYISSLDGYNGPLRPFTLGSLQKYDLASRRSHRADLRVNLLLRDDMDLALTGQIRSDDYGANYGLQDDRTGSVSLEWGWQPSADVNVHALGSLERGDRKIRNIDDPGGGTFPSENAWELESERTSAFAGAGFEVRVLERVTIESTYRFTYTRERLDYDFAGASALGSRFPTLNRRDHSILSALRFAVTEHVGLRVFYMFERGEVDDFQQDGLRDPTLLTGIPGTGAGTLFLGHVDHDYSAHVIGGTVQLKY